MSAGVIGTRRSNKKMYLPCSRYQASCITEGCFTTLFCTLPGTNGCEYEFYTLGQIFLSICTLPIHKSDQQLCFSRFDPKLAEKCHFHVNGYEGGNIGSGNTADGYFSLRTLAPRYPTPKMGIPKIWYHKSANLTRSGLLIKRFLKVLYTVRAPLITAAKL